MLSKNQIVMLALLFVLVVLSLAVPVKNPTGYAVGSDDLVFPRCEYDKANIDKLSSTKFGGCQKHYDYFDAYRDDIDLLYLYAVAYQESSCRDAQQLRSSGSKVWAGGILQVDNPCLCSASKIEGYESCYANYGGRWQCSDVGDQVRQGIELIKKSYDYLENKKIKSPEDLFLLASLEHNRGRTTVANTISYMNKYDVVTSMIKSCEEIYNKDGNGCPLCKYDSSGNDKCRTVGLGAGYPYKIFQYYEEACSLVGGSLNFDVGEYEELLKGTISQRTGFFVRRPVVRQKVGTYELNPSFLLKEFFDFETFNRIRDELSVLSENCSESKNKKGCVEAFLGDASKNTEKLKIGPQEEDEAELFGIAEKIFLCSNDNFTDCYCSVDFDSSKLGGFDNLAVYSQENKIRVRASGSTKYEFSGEIISGTHTDFRNAFLVSLDDTGKLSLYSNTTTEYADKLFSSKECLVDQNTFVLTKKTEDEIFFFDGEKHVVKKPDIEFAFMLRDITPPDNVTFFVEPHKLNDKEILIWFKELEESDLEDYYLFYSDQDFEDQNIITVLQDYYTGPVKYKKLLENSLSINSFKNYGRSRYDSLQPECFAKNAGAYCDAHSSLTNLLDSSFKMKLVTNNTYHFSAKNEYAHILNFSEPGEHYFSVLGVDKYGNIQRNAETIMVEVSDLLKPSVSGVVSSVERVDSSNINLLIEAYVEKNFDETTLEDFEEFWVYYSPKDKRTNRLANTNLEFTRATPQITTADIVIPISFNENPNMSFCYLVVPFDEKRVSGKDYSLFFERSDYYLEILDVDSGMALFEPVCVDV